MRWDEQDRFGNPIYLTSERWEHALEKRPWLADHFDDVLDTIRHGRRTQDPLKPNKYKYYWPCSQLEPEFNHIIVIVLFQEIETDEEDIIPNNYVVNVWAAYIYSR